MFAENGAQVTGKNQMYKCSFKKKPFQSQNGPAKFQNRIKTKRLNKIWLWVWKRCSTRWLLKIHRFSPICQLQSPAWVPGQGVDHFCGVCFWNGSNVSNSDKPTTKRPAKGFSREYKKRINSRKGSIELPFVSKTRACKFTYFSPFLICFWKHLTLLKMELFANTTFPNSGFFSKLKSWSLERKTQRRNLRASHVVSD